MDYNVKTDIAVILNYIFLTEEQHYETVCDEFGAASEAAEGHIYNLARTVWVELELDFNGGKS